MVKTTNDALGYVVLTSCSSNTSDSMFSRETGSRADLAAVLEIFQQSPLFFGGVFPSRLNDVSGKPNGVVFLNIFSQNL
jgi:hypothetical protein